MNAEEWRPVVGFDGYFVSSLGRVSSTRRGDNRIMRGCLDGHGYRKVGLRDGVARVERYVHALVAEAFHGPRPEGYVTRHLDGDKTNNSAANVRFGSQSENELDKVRHGTDHNARKTHCPKRHLYDEANTYVNRGSRQCRACRRECIALYRQREAFRAAGISSTAWAS